MALPELEPCEEIVPDVEVWYRQGVAAYSEDAEYIGALSFRPSSSDGGRLSGVRSSMRSPQEAYEDRHRIAPGKTTGTWAIAVADLANLGLYCVYDAQCDLTLPVGHSYVDVGSVADAKALRQRLLALANETGRLWP